MASLDEIITRLGFGRYQIRNYILISVLMLFHPFQILLIPFVARKMIENQSLRCQTFVPLDKSIITENDRSVDRTYQYQNFCTFLKARVSDNDSFDNGSRSGSSCYLDNLLRRVNSHPLGSNSEVIEVEEVWNICVSRNDSRQNGTLFFESSPKFMGSNVTCCTNRTQTSEQRDSIVSEWNLRGSREYLIPLASSIFMVGSIVGSFVFAAASDNFGRKKALAISVTTFVAATIAPGLWSPWYEIFVLYRFVQGMCHSGNFMIHMVMLTELLPRNKRYILTIVSTLFYSMGFVTLAGLAYVLVKWRSLQIITGTLMGGYILAFFFIDDSVYWLVDKGHLDRASRLIVKSARQNGLTDPFFTYETVLGCLEEMNRTKMGLEKPFLVKDSSFELESPRVRASKNCQLLDLFTVPILRKRTFLVAACTFFLFQIHMALKFGIYILRGNMYVNFALLGLAEIPGDLMGLCAMNRLGNHRKRLIPLAPIITGWKFFDESKRNRTLP